MNHMEIDLEEWVINLFNSIDNAAVYNQNYKLELSKEKVMAISLAWDKITNVELS